jgi:maltose alpha-D-glucosyltransferase / alpha-amylase
MPGSSMHAPGARVNVASQRLDPDSLLNWTARLIAARKDCHEMTTGEWDVVDQAEDRALVLRYDEDDRSLLVLHNLSAEAVEVELKAQEGAGAMHDRLRSGTDPERAR